MTPTETASDVIAASVRERRKRLGWNVATLAERCASVGAPELSASVIQNIEHGRPRDGKRTRFVTAEELLGLARALSVSPAALCPQLAELPEGMNRDLSDFAQSFNATMDQMEQARERYEETAAKLQRRLSELDKERGEETPFIDPVRSPFHLGGADDGSR